MYSVYLIKVPSLVWQTIPYKLRLGTPYKTQFGKPYKPQAARCYLTKVGLPNRALVTCLEITAANRISSYEQTGGGLVFFFCLNILYYTNPSSFVFVLGYRVLRLRCAGA